MFIKETMSDIEYNEFIHSIVETACKLAQEEHKICTEIEIYPDYFKVRFEPWEPFEYTCPYKEKS